MSELKMVSDTDSISDEELCSIVAEGGEEANDANEILLLRYKEFVKAKVRPYYLIGSDNEDLVQEGMIGLYKAIRDYSPEKAASFKTFADLCVTRQIITAIKTATRTKHQPLNNYISLYCEGSDSEGISIEELFEDDSQPDPEKIIIETETKDQIQKKFRELLSKYENSVLNLYLEGYSYSYIAEKLGKEPKSIDNALQRVKSKLQKEIGFIDK